MQYETLSYEVDPLICPYCWTKMRIISVINELFVIEKILRHLGLWDIRNHGPPVPESPHSLEPTYDDTYSQLPPVDYYLQ